MSFPSNFTWGTATSSYQIEGAAKEDGRGPSIWDTFAATPGKVVNGENGDVACDHYHRYPEDIALMKKLGVSAYRFSIAWPRLFPTGSGVRENRGFDFYSRLIDKLLENEIQPIPTIYHWDLPQSIQDRGGWANRDIVKLFADYSHAVGEAYGDRVEKWITINEPWCLTWLGYMSGVHAPGIRDLDQAVAAAHHTALAHAEATRALRSLNSGFKIGQSLNMTNYIVTNPNNPDLVELANLQDAHINRWWIEAELTGKYPQNLVDYFGENLQRVMLAGDEELLRVNTDFLGINYYSDSFLSDPRPSDGRAMDGGPHPFPQRASGAVPQPTTDMGWPITPEGIKNLLMRIHRDWPEIRSIAITENGAAYDYPIENGEVNDTLRINYLTSHLDEVAKAIELGSNVDSYFAWSFMDNFEWAEGYQKRFGIVHVDFDTLERTLKSSAKVYGQIIAANGVKIS